MQHRLNHELNNKNKRFNRLFKISFYSSFILYALNSFCFIYLVGDLITNHGYSKFDTELLWLFIVSIFFITFFISMCYLYCENDSRVVGDLELEPFVFILYSMGYFVMFLLIGRKYNLSKILKVHIDKDKNVFVDTKTDKGIDVKFNSDGKTVKDCIKILSKKNLNKFKPIKNNSNI